MKKVIIIIVVLAMAFCMIAAGYPEKESNENYFEECINYYCNAFLEATDNRAVIKREGNRVTIMIDSGMAPIDVEGLDGFGIVFIVFDGDANTVTMTEIANLDGESVFAHQVVKVFNWDPEIQDCALVFSIGEFK